MVTGADIAAAARELLGVWYVWWQEGDPIPMWLDDWGNEAPPREHMDQVGVMCFPGNTKVLADGVEKSYKRVYRGELVTIKTSSGNELSGTPNHPVLSTRGWVALKDLQKGDHVFSSPGFGKLTGGDLHDDDEPTHIEKVHRSLVMSGSSERISSTPLDFHGDGRDGQVDVVLPNGKLRNRFKSSLSERHAELTFALPNLTKVPLSRERGADFVPLRTRTSPRPFVCRAGQGLARLFRHPSIAQSRSLRSTPANTALLEPPVDDVLRHPEIPRDLPLGLPSPVAPNNLVNIDIQPDRTRPPGCFAPLQVGSFLDGVHLDPSFLEPLPHRGTTDAKTSGDLAYRFSTQVRPDKVIDIKRHAFSGHVYNLQTSSGHYLAEGIVSHNCSDLVNYARMRCGLPPVGGCPAYYDWLIANGTGGTFNPSTPGVAGAICVNPGPWRGDNVLAQGHISIYTDEHTLIQATDGQGAWAGVHEGEQDHDAGWANYWLYGLMPDVNYEGADQPDEMVVTPQEIPSVATELEINWFGIGSDNIVRLGAEGVNWDKGWIGQRPDGTLVRVK